jgi:hypothetical protein
MTLDEWLEYADAETLSDELSPFADRPLRLFACACLRRVWPLLPSESWREAVEAYERFTDGRLREQDLLEMCAKAELETAEGFWSSRGTSWPAYELCDCPYCQRDEEPALRESMREALEQSDWIAAKAAFYAAGLMAHEAEPKRREAARDAERRAQYALFHDILGAPTRTYLDPSWLRWNRGCVTKMARTIYAENRFGDLPILADALEEAGCVSEAIISHCRSNQIHVRGCWVVDALRAAGKKQSART